MKKKGHIKRDCFFNPDSYNFKPHLIKGKSQNGSHGSRSGQSRDEKAHIAFVTKVNLTEYDEDGMTEMWFLDSCASQHMCNNFSVFKRFVDNTSIHEHRAEIETSKKERNMPAKGGGTVILECQ